MEGIKFIIIHVLAAAISKVFSCSVPQVLPVSHLRASLESSKKALQAKSVSLLHSTRQRTIPYISMNSSMNSSMAHHIYRAISADGSIVQSIIPSSWIADDDALYPA